MTDAVQPDTGDALATPGTLVCEGSVCAVVGAESGAAIVPAAPAAAADWLDGLLVKQISNQVDEAGASLPHAG